MALGYYPLSLDCVEVSTFPDIALYVKQGANYILYKNRGVRLTNGDVKRLQANRVEYVHVSSENADIVRTYLEKNIVGILSDNSLSHKSKNSILCPVLMNYVSDIFKDPQKNEPLDKCRSLLRYLADNLADREELMGLLSNLAMYNAYLVIHSAQVAILSMYVHKTFFNLFSDELLDVGIGGILHDIGMTRVAGDILEKADTLSKHEYYRVRHHTRYSHDILVKMGIKEPIPLTIALSHHERYNGTGYPNRLYEKEIPRSALVAGMCDVYCALTTDRPYRAASTPEAAIKTMTGEKRLFHPEMFADFCNLMTE